MHVLPVREHDVCPLAGVQLQLLNTNKTVKVTHDIDISQTVVARAREPNLQLHLQFFFVFFTKARMRECLLASFPVSLSGEPENVLPIIPRPFPPYAYTAKTA